jgi:hypothetical protein
MNKRFCNNCNDKNWIIECACGCGMGLPRYSRYTQLRKYIKNHGNGLANYKGGRTKDKSGYWLILNKDHYKCNGTGYIREHILVYEDHYKCCILPGFQIHHINKNEGDNRIENLQLISSGQHMKIHHKGKIVSEETRKKRRIDMSNRFCSNCKKTTTYISKLYNRPVWYSDKKGGWWCNSCRTNIYKKLK